MAKRVSDAELNRLLYGDEFTPRYDVVQDQSQGFLSNAVGMTGDVLTSKPVAGALKILDLPRIIVTDVVAGAVQAGYEFVDKILDGSPVEAITAFKDRAIDTFENLGKDIFTFDLKTSFDGSDALNAYLDAFGVNKEDVSGWVKIPLSIAFEMGQDPTSFFTPKGLTNLTSGYLKSATKGAGQSAVKRLAKQGLTTEGKQFVAGLKTILDDSVARQFAGDVMKASNIAEGSRMTADLVDKFGLTATYTKQYDDVSRNFARELGNLALNPEAEKLLGETLDVYKGFGQFNAKAVQTAKEFWFRSQSNYDEAVEFLSKKSVQELEEAGLNEVQIQALKNPWIVSGRKVRGVGDMTFAEVKDAATSFGFDFKGVSTNAKAPVEEVLEASRKYGGDAQLFGDLYDQNARANWWAYKADLNTAISKPNMSIERIKKAHNFARVMGVGTYANPLWWAKGALYGVAGGKAGRTKLIEGGKRIYKTLLGETTSKYASDVATVFDDALLGPNPTSQTWFEKLWGTIIFGPAGRQMQREADQAISAVDEAYGLVAHRTKRIISDYGKDVTEYAKTNGVEAVSDAIQLSPAQRAAYASIKGDVKPAVIAQMMKDIKEAGHVVTDDIASKYKLGAVDSEAFATPAWAIGARDSFQDILDVERTFFVGEQTLSDATSYLPLQLHDDVFDTIEKHLKNNGVWDIIVEESKNTNLSIRDMIDSKVIARNMRDLPISYVNKLFREKGIDALLERGFLDTFIEKFAKSNENITNVIKEAFGELQSLNRAPFIEDYFMAIKKRMNRHYQDAIMSSTSELMEKAGFISKYQHAIRSSVLRSRVKELYKDRIKAGESVDEIVKSLGVEDLRMIASTSKKGRAFKVTDEAVIELENMGYKMNEKGLFTNVAPEDLKKVVPSGRITMKQDGKEFLLDLDSNQIVRKQNDIISAEKVIQARRSLSAAEKTNDPLQIQNAQKKLDSYLSRMQAQNPEEYTKVQKYLDTGEAQMFKSFEQLHDFTKASAAGLNPRESAYSYLLRSMKGGKGGIPQVSIGQTAIITRKNLVRLLRDVQASPESTQEEIQFLYDMLNASTPGFADVSDAAARTKLAELGMKHGFLNDNFISQAPQRALNEMTRMSIDLRNVMMRKKAPLYGAFKEFVSILQLDKIAGWSTMMANQLGNPVYALQGGLTMNPKTWIKAALMYSSLVGRRTSNKLDRLIKMLPANVREQVQKGTKKIDDVYLPEVKMTIGEMFDITDARGVTHRGYMYDLVQHANNYRSGLDVELGMGVPIPKRKKAYGAFKKFLSLPGSAIGMMADDPWRFLFFYDAMANRGMSVADAAQATFRYLGDFNPVKRTKFDKAASDFVFFYRFRKWNTIQQMRVMAVDPKWASFIGKVNRSMYNNMSDDERAVATSARYDFMPMAIARRDDTGTVWDRDGKVTRSAYALMNPFGNYYAPLDAIQWAEPHKNALDSLILGSDLAPDESGIFNNLLGAMTAFSDSLGDLNPEEKSKKRMEAAARLTNSSRILRYMKPVFMGDEQAGKRMYERITRGATYTQYVSLRDALSKTKRKALKRTPQDELDTYTIMSIEKALNQLRQINKKTPEELMPYDDYLK